MSGAFVLALMEALTVQVPGIRMFGRYNKVAIPDDEG
jgi:hypothetical protein